MNYQARSDRHPSWRGVFAGLLMGLVTSMVMLSLALVLGSFLSLDLRGAGIASGVYAVITALISAFVAGYFAVKASAPETLLGEGTEILPKDATLIGTLTAASIVVLTTFLAMSGIGGAVRTAGAAIGHTTGALTSAVGTVASATATVGGTAVGAAGSSDTVMNKAQDLYQKVSGKIQREDIETWIAESKKGLEREQVAAAVQVLEDMVNKTKNEIAAMDFTNLDTWKNLDDYAVKRFAEIEKTVNGDEIISLLQKAGLSQEQAEKLREEAVNAYQEYKAKAEQAVNEAKAAVKQALADAEEATRKAALYSGLFWLISTLLTFAASIAGAKKAAVNYRLATPSSNRTA